MLRFTGLLAALVMVVTLAGCYGPVWAPHHGERVVAREPGPPPHAPAHGYRRKHASGAVLQFDTNLGAYVVIRHTNVYFHDGRFIRIRNGIWQVSATLDGPWKPRKAKGIPPGLRSKHHAKKPKVQGRGAAKIAR